MPHEPFNQDDLPLINRILEQHPEVSEVIGIVKQVSKKAKFPIAAFEELAEVLGGEDAVIIFREQPLRVGELHKGIPAYYFPIGSENDLIAKVSDLRARSGAPVPPLEGVAMAEEVPLPEGLHPPDIPVPSRPAQAGGVGVGRREEVPLPEGLHPPDIPVPPRPAQAGGVGVGRRE